MKRQRCTTRCHVIRGRLTQYDEFQYHTCTSQETDKIEKCLRIKLNGQSLEVVILVTQQELKEAQVIVLARIKNG